MKKILGKTWAVWALLVLFLSGCGDRPTLVPVSGRVLIDGQPLTYGSVRFLPPNSRLSSGSLDSEGRFTLTCMVEGDGAVLGPHAVEVLAMEHISDTKMKWLVPKKYSDASTSGLTREITGPTEDVLIELTWDGGKPFIEVFEGSGEENPGSAF